MSGWDPDRGRMGWEPPGAFTCPRCGMTSHHPLDALEGYCGNCHDWTGAAGPMGHYDRQGRRIPLRQWAEMQEGDKHVAEDFVIVDGEPIRVSTVWIGIDLNFGFGPPLIFETMTFGHGDHADLQARYSTEAAALAGHERIVAYLTDARRGSAPPS